MASEFQNVTKVRILINYKSIGGVLSYKWKDIVDRPTRLSQFKNDLDKLGNIAVTSPVDLDSLQLQLNEIANEDLATYFINQITF